MAAAEPHEPAAPDTGAGPLPELGQLPLDLRPPLAPTLDNFVVGRNAEALAAVRRLAGPPAPGSGTGGVMSSGPGPQHLLYLWGEPGSGRSHLLGALQAAGGWRWTPAHDPSRPGLALVDDVDQIDPAAQVALFSRLHAVLSGVRTLGTATLTPVPRCLVCGPQPPAQLALRDDVRSRLANGLVYRLHALNDAEMTDALEARARARGARVAEDLVPWMLTHLPRDMGRLAAALDALDTYALARQRPLTVPLLRDWLAADLPDVTPSSR
jgi:DnaA family protein